MSAFLLNVLYMFLIMIFAMIGCTVVGTVLIDHWREAEKDIDKAFLELEREYEREDRLGL